MVQVQVDLTNDQDWFVTLWKRRNKLDSKGEAIKQIVEYADYKYSKEKGKTRKKKEVLKNGLETAVKGDCDGL